MENRDFMESDIHAIARILADSVDGHRRFAGAIGLTQTEIDDIRTILTRENCANFTYNLFSRVLKKWLDKNGGKLGMRHLHCSLKNEGFNAAAESLEKYVDTVPCAPKVPPEILDRIWFEIEAPPINFTGRVAALEKLHELITNLQDDITVISQLIAVSGLGGIGKSTLANKYAQIHSNYYTNCIWINAESADSMWKSFKRLAVDYLNLELDAKKTKKCKFDQKIMNQIYSDERICKRKTLIIFDNAEAFVGENGIERFLTKLHPNIPQPFVLVTSRKTDLIKNSSQTFVLEVLSEEEAITFLFREAELDDLSIPEEKENARKLVKDLQMLPLALKQAAAYIRQNKKYLRFAESPILSYMSKYETKTKEMLDDKLIVSKSGETTVYITWKVTYEKIDKNKDFGSIAYRLLKQIAYLHADNVPIECLRNLRDEGTGKLVDEDQIEGGLELLQTYSMIMQTPAREKQGPSLSVHRLVQQVLRMDMSISEELDFLRIGRYLIVEETTGYYEKEECFYLLRDNSYIPHAKALCDHLLEKHDNFLKSIPDFPVNISWQCQKKGYYETAHEIAEKYSQKYQDIYGSENYYTLKVKERLANSYEFKNDFEKAIEIYRAIYEIGKEKPEYSENSELMQTIAQNLCVVLVRNRDYHGAMEIFKEMLGTERARKTFAFSMEEVMPTIEHLIARGSELDLLQFFYTMQKKVFDGFSHPSLMETVFRIGLELEKEGRFKEALEKLEDVLERRTEVLGDGHDETVETMKAVERIRNRCAEVEVSKN